MCLCVCVSVCLCVCLSLFYVCVCVCVCLCHTPGLCMMSIGGAMASEPLEGFHEVNLASPTTPDLHGLADQRPSKSVSGSVASGSTPPTAIYRTHSLTAPPNALRADQLPTQPVYSTPHHLGTHLANEQPHNGRWESVCVEGREGGREGEGKEDEEGQK